MTHGDFSFEGDKADWNREPSRGEVFDDVALPITVIGPDGRVAYANAAARSPLRRRKPSRRIAWDGSLRILRAGPVPVVTAVMAGGANTAAPPG